jgi:hypothetical protein
LYYYDTKWAASKQDSSKPVGSGNEDAAKSRYIRNMKMESPLKVLKVLQVSSENRMGVQVHTIRGPENSLTSQNVSFEWCHLHGDQLDFSQFKEACVNMPGLSERLKTLIVKTLEKIEKEKLKAFLGGMFIEPGTVLRGDESDRDDALSVIFACVPFFEVQTPQKPSYGKADRFHPPRTLMQTYYPYEPVRERDEEQAFKKFKSGSSSNNIIHLPSLWVMNIGTEAVVTCGYRPLASDFVKSITIVQEDIKALDGVSTSSNGDITNANSTNIRLRDWDGRTLLFTISECPTYFHIEQKLRELKYRTSKANSNAFELVWTTKKGERRISPRHWQSIIKNPNSMFIDISVFGKRTIPIIDEGDVNSGNIASPNSSLPPFFEWPSPKDLKSDGIAEGGDETVRQFQFIPPEINRSMQCLEQVEKWMMSEPFDDFYDNIVGQTSTSPDYYQSLPEKTLEDVRGNFVSLLGSTANSGKDNSNYTYHQVVVENQCSKLASEAASFVDVVYQTLRLFVDNVDENPMLRKIWGALMNVGAIVEQVQRSGVCKSDEKELTDPSWVPPLTGIRGWFIRNPNHSLFNGKFVPFPQDENMKANIKHCRDCRHNRRYYDAESAFQHIRQHAIHVDENPRSGRRVDNFMGANKEPNPKDWTRNLDQIQVEEMNAGYLAILINATGDARLLLKEIQELADGATSVDGKLSSLYTLPYELLHALRRLIVFYLSVERAFHYYEKDFQSPLRRRRYVESRAVEPHYLTPDFTAVQNYGDYVKITLLAARKELCNMTRSRPAIDIEKRLSLGPEYLCCWFMRRLLVKPVDNSMTVADLYREYLSTLQFQANHRPSKRLLRDINLLHEELSALEQINFWQTNLIVSYNRVLSDRTYPNDDSSRRALYPVENMVLDSCLEHLADALADYREMNKRCGPISELTKQSSEINDEDHGKAILVFTVVTIIFLPLSFVTSYLGMNTSDIRDMEDKQSLFWEIAIPLTVVTMGSMMFIAYNGEDIRGHFTAIYRKLTGKQDIRTNGRGIGVAQRKRASKFPSESSSTLVDFRSLADEAEFLPPQPTWNQPRYFMEQQFQSMINTEWQNKYLDTQPKLFTEDAGYDAHPVPALHRPQRPSRYAMGESRPPPLPADDMYLASVPEPTTTYASPFSRISSQQYPIGPRMDSQPPIPPRMHSKINHAPFQPPPPPPPPPGQMLSPYAGDPEPPTYIRIHKRFLDIDTLASFGLPWEYDLQNPDYYVIFKYLSSWETDELFRDTKRLRNGRKGNRHQSGHRRSSDHVYGYRQDSSTPVDQREHPWVQSRTKRGNRHISPISERSSYYDSQKKRERGREKQQQSEKAILELPKKVEEMKPTEQKEKEDIERSASERNTTEGKGQGKG